ncbi:Rhs family protein (plasmid) [Deinococcus gobiensis I-0]|uniref:Rhs family protein n=1 Tax=Deinococcus gobiensis (strain DSM 21396 / JCM 16679 / CGMCC 1.7299 / I-0) TaxID=745776 RepID=H8H3Z7_DEIGI|nr:Rhs family protein [Deinococcus gobiensis I-0]
MRPYRRPPVIQWSGEHRSRRIGTTLALTYLLVTQVLLPSAGLATLYQTTPLPGVATTPLPYELFGGGENFGDLTDALNLATGQVFPDIANAKKATSGADPDPATTQITTSPALRLLGFQGSGSGGSEEIQTQNLKGSQWGGYGVAPELSIGTLIKSNDENLCQTENKTVSGVLVEGRLEEGTYQVSVQARSTGASFPVNFGMDDSRGTDVMLTNSMQTFTRDFNLSGSTQNRIFQIKEWTKNNPDWEVLGVSVRKVNGGSLGENKLPVKVLSNWLGYCGPQSLTPIYRMESKDGDTDGRSGIIHRGVPKTSGTYKIKFEGRVSTGNLEVHYGLDDHNSKDVTLNDQWQTFESEYTINNYDSRVYDADRTFQIFEGVKDNPAWEIRNISVRSTRSLSNLTPDSDYRSNEWVGYFQKPALEPMLRIFSRDGGCNGPISGLIRRQNLVPGRYRLSLDARSTGQPFRIGFGIDDGHSIGVGLTNQWQNFVYEADINQNGTNDNRAIQLREDVPNNPDWEVGNFKLQKLENNVWQDSVFTNSGPSDWQGYCIDTPTANFFRLKSSDHPENNYSGLIFLGQEKRGLGKYNVSFQGRTRSGTLNIGYGLDDTTSTGATLNDQWQTFNTTFNINKDNAKDYHMIRQFQIFESTKGNVDWEIKDVRVEPIVEKLVLQDGDGSYTDFNLYQPDFSTVPSWISRYQTDGSSMFYRSTPRPGTAFSEQWIVVRSVNNTPVAHFYDKQGTRTTFYGDGQYADFSQTPHEQYLSAKEKNDPDGIASGSPKTEFTYTAPGNGRLQSVQDRWGRVTKYIWNEQQGYITNILYNLSDINDFDTYARKIKYEYNQMGDRRVISSITFVTGNGRGNDLNNRIQRRYYLQYSSLPNGEPRLWKIQRPALGLEKLISNEYGYDDQQRVISIKQTGLLDTFINYKTLSWGTEVSQSQGDKLKVYQFNSDGTLANFSQKDSQASNMTGENMTLGSLTQFKYDTLGRLIIKVEPDKSQTQFLYDDRGNLVHEVIYSNSSQAYSNPPAGYYRKSSYKYDKDNQITSNYTDDGSNKSGNEFGYENFETSNVLGLNFSALKSITETIYGNNKAKRSTTTSYDSSGRLEKSEVRSGDSKGILHITNEYSYYNSLPSDVNIVNISYNSEMVDGLNNLQSRKVKQYGDQIKLVNSNGRKSEFTYDEYGNQYYRRDLNSFNSSISFSKGTNGLNNLINNFSDRLTITAYSGFGDIVADVMLYGGESLKTAKAKQFNRYPTGEIIGEWEGIPDNLTLFKYSFADSRLIGIEKGKSDRAGFRISPSNIRIKEEYIYDDYGRIISSSKTTGGNSYVVKDTFDTMDRIVKTESSNGITVQTEYSPGSSIKKIIKTDTLSKKSTTIEYTNNSLGLRLQETFKNGEVDAGNIKNSFDAFGNITQSIDNRLTMLDSEDARTSYFTYDSFGRLIKKLGPQASNSPYNDTRRQYEEHEYNWQDLETLTKTLINGTVSPSNMSMPLQGEIAETTSTYDSFGNLITRIDPRGYTERIEYDNSNQPIKNSQQVWKESEEDFKKVAFGSYTLDTYSSYNAAGKVYQSIDGNGNISSVFYNRLDLPIIEVNNNGIVNKVYTYTPDFLIEEIWEPDNNINTSAFYDKFDYTQPSQTHSRMKYLQYGNSPYPTQQWTAYMNDSAGPNIGTQTEFEYDAMGRITKSNIVNTMPGYDTLTENKYDSLGRLIYNKNPNGITTEFSYDLNGNLLGKIEKGYQGSVDEKHFPNGLTSSYTYDLSNNLTKKLERGKIVEYAYNSSGKVISESLPRIGENTPKRWKNIFYRLDNLPVAKTDSNYQGNVLTKINSMGSKNNDQPSISSGNLITYSYDSIGNLRYENSYGSIILYTGAISPAQREYSKEILYNGIGQKYKRIFLGSTAIYERQKTKNITPLEHSNSITYYKSDLNNNLIEKWDTPSSESDPRSEASDNDIQNYFSYGYSPTNKQTYSSRKIVIRHLSPSKSNVLYSKYGGQNGISFGNSDANSNTKYNERDNIVSYSVTDIVPSMGSDNQPRQDEAYSYATSGQSYTYYTDGSVYNSCTTNTSNAGSVCKTVNSYDKLGRETAVFDGNGALSKLKDSYEEFYISPTESGKPTNIAITYKFDGSSKAEYKELDGKIAYQSYTPPISIARLIKPVLIEKQAYTIDESTIWNDDNIYDSITGNLMGTKPQVTDTYSEENSVITDENNKQYNAKYQKILKQLNIRK